ncbi:MAG: hypothetical protein EBW68_06025 [Actinobacteria bacterium]|jgi:hypothetical protein|nr:hypothetical protein [Actinomycetota bacterium]
MQVFQLIEQLMDLDPNAEVHFSYNYGDHWRTEVAPKVGSVLEGMVKYSEYHRMDRLLDEDEMYEEEGDFEGARRVIVLG